MNPAERSLELASLLEGTSITLLSLTEGGATLTLRRPATGAPVAVAPTQQSITAPCAGVFLTAHPLRTEPLAETGRPVAAGDVLGLLRIGPLLIEIHAPTPGILAEVAAADGALVGFGTALFRLSPGGHAP